MPKNFGKNYLEEESSTFSNNYTSVYAYNKKTFYNGRHKVFVDIKFAHSIYVDKLLTFKLKIKIRTNCLSADIPLNCFENYKAAVTNTEANVYSSVYF